MGILEYTQQALDDIASEVPLDVTPTEWDGPTIYDEMMKDRRYGMHVVARNTDPETSHKAAASVANLTATHARVLALFQQFGPLSDPEVRQYWQRMMEGGDYPPITDSGLRTRRAELVSQGKLKDSGVRAKTPTGRECIVWQLDA